MPRCCWDLPPCRGGLPGISTAHSVARRSVTLSCLKLRPSPSPSRLPHSGTHPNSPALLPTVQCLELLPHSLPPPALLAFTALRELVAKGVPADVVHATACLDVWDGVLAALRCVRVCGLARLFVLTVCLLVSDCNGTYDADLSVSLKGQWVPSVGAVSGCCLLSALAHQAQAQAQAKALEWIQ